VQLLLPDTTRASGLIRGVDHDGSLLLLTDEGVRRYNLGEISLRPEPYSVLDDV
jgi:biotin-(acetyl-CoA carboxylase) ligase